MKKLIAVIVFIAAVGAGRAQGTFEAMTVGDSAAGSFNGLAGWTFQLLFPVTLTDLGCTETIITDNGGSPIRVGLWAGASLVADRYIGTTSPLLLNGTRYEPVASLILVPGTTYHLGAYSSSGSIGLNLVGPGFGTYSVAAAIDSPSVHRTENASGFAAPTEIPGSLTIASGPNLRYFVPEPSSLALLSLAGLGWFCRRRRA